MKMTFTVVCGTPYPEGDLNIKYLKPCDTLEEAFDKIDNHLVGYPIELIEVRLGDHVWTLDAHGGDYRPIVR